MPRNILQLLLRNVGGVEIHGADVEICQNTNLGLKISIYIVKKRCLGCMLGKIK